MKKLLQSLFLLMLFAVSAIAQDRTVTGTVTDKDDGLPLPGVSVKVVGTTAGVSTGADGKFSLRVPAGSNKLQFSFIGYTTQEVTIPSRNVVTVALQSDARALNEVVVTAGGVNVQRRELGAQATTVKATELTQGKAINVAAGLSGKVAGLQVNAVSSGVNPSYRLVLRGNRSLTGNNQALVVVDNVIAPNSILGNLNPEDIEDIQVLNGASAAALYGSDASNGAMIITTKKGKRGVSQVRVANTTTLENVSFLPQVQSQFGSGTTPDYVPTYTPYENQQYGPAFDGSMRPIGKPLQDGSIQTVEYSPKNAKHEFWETGLTNTTDFSIQSGDEKSTIYLGAQYVEQESTVPYDRYNRFGLRANGTRVLSNKLNLSYNAYYVQNRYDISTATGTAYNDLLQSPAQVDVTKYENWKTDPFANPNGYFNEYYDNPYFTLSNNRQKTRNDYLQGSVDFKFTPIKPLTITYRLGVTTQNDSYKTTTGKFTFTDYTKSISGSSKTDVAGNVGDGTGFSTQLVSDLYGEFATNFNKDFSFKATVGGSLRDNNAKDITVGANGLVIPELYNISNSLNTPTAGESVGRTRQLGAYADLRFGFRDYLYLHVTGRNDWRSVLSADNRSFFYPAADVSFIASEAIPALKQSNVIESLKLRGGYSKVGQVNLGAYALATTFGQGAGYPFSSGAGFTMGGVLVAPNIEPEMTTGYEAGFDLEMLRGRVSSSFTYYKTNTVDQTLSVGISTASGFSSFRTNTGDVENKGLEASLQVTPVRTSTGLEVSVRGTYTHNQNKVISLSNDQDELTIGSSGNGQVVAKKGESFPLLKVTKYNRDPQGRIIVDAVTGYPSTDGSYSPIGTTNPPHILSLDGVIRYKRFRLTSLFEFRTGNVIYNSVTTGFDFSGAGIRTTWYNRDRFVVPNSSYLDPATNTYVPNTNITTRSGGADFWTDGTRNTGIGENYVASAAFWKWREASLSYEIPASALGSLKYIKGATISVQGRNLLLLTPESNLYTDPEYSAAGASSNAIGLTTLGQTPPARYFGATVSLTF